MRSPFTILTSLMNKYRYKILHPIREDLSPIPPYFTITFVSPFYSLEMPLIIVCGVPLCGKTRRTAEIISKLESVMSDHPWTGINLVNDENSGVAYSDYGDFNKEKEARGKIRSQAEKYVDADSITIIDSPNYIKGFRYELWCVARAAGTNCCCVVPVGNYNECRQRNKERSDGETYTEQQLDELITRWEEPDKNRRWESPLLPVLDEEEIDVDVLISAISGKGMFNTS